MDMRKTLFSIRFWLLILLVFGLSQAPLWAVKEVVGLPKGFVYLSKVAPDVIQEIRYYGSDNFTGCPVPGYEEPVAIVTWEVARALKAVNRDAAALGYALKIFDAYRPQQAVDYFISWAQQPEDNLSKAAFYPNVDKSQLFKLGYVAAQSGHTRGGTVDVTLVDLATGMEADMGTPYDFMDKLSHYAAKGLSYEQIYNRSVLQTLMESHGFKPYNEEWWHFTLINEPYPDTYFDFPVR